MQQFLDKLVENKIQKFEKSKIEEIQRQNISCEQLDKHQYLEKYLIPHLKQNNINQEYFIELVRMINYKSQDNIFIWDYQDDHSKFDILFNFLIKQKITKFQDNQILEIINFLILHFQKLEYEKISKKVLQLISSPLLLKTSKVYLKSYLLDYPNLIDLISKLMKNKNAAQNQEYQIIPDIYELLFLKSENTQLVNAIIQLFTELLSQLSTRKFLKPYLKGNFLIPKLKLSKIEGYQQLKYLIDFPLNDENGEPLTIQQIQLKRSDFQKRLQIGVFKHFDLQFSLLEITSLKFLNSLSNPQQDLIKIYQFMGIPLPDQQDYDFLKEVFQDFIPEDIDQSIEDQPIIPGEDLLWPQKDFKLLRMNLQFLSIQDYLSRNFHLVRHESAYEISKDIEDCIEKMTPKFDEKKRFINFDGWSRMGIHIQQIQMHEVLQPKIGKSAPQRVFAEITYSVQNMPNYLRKEWESLKKYDIIFLVAFGQNSYDGQFCNKYNIDKVRGCEIVAHLDEEKNPIEQSQKGLLRTLNVLFDPQQYRNDFQSHNLEFFYQSMKLIVRRKSKENNFKAQLQSIQNIYSSQIQLPEFLDQVILGYGQYDQQINSQFFQNINFYDTFIDQNHFKECFTNNKLLPQELRGQSEIIYDKIALNKFQKPNIIRFTDLQVKGLIHSVQEGMSLIKGPPGTGKTDLVVQAISLLYRNFPNQRILVLTHSNQALNDIFEKIRNTDSIQERHLLRLGMGGEKVYGDEKDFSFGRMGRVNYLLKRRLDLLQTAKELALSIDYLEDQFTCETADIFFNFQIRQRWNEYQKTQDFPFKKYFGDRQDFEQCFNEIQDLFEQIKQLRFLELLRNNSERADSILCNYARVLAMTCTHAALKREKLLQNQFEFDSIVCEEQGQILEISTFIAMNLQKKQKLKRVILVGDENQLPPVIKNSELQKKGNMEQSMFKRFIRLGFNITTLCHQGRSRPSILKLFNWQYPNLISLPNVEQKKAPSEYAYTNVGFQHEVQFVNVKGREIQPNPYFYQNLEEAEFIVATYMYLRLKGVPAEKITILTTYNGQKFLIRDIVHQKCSWNTFFSRPHKITTVDKYQGQQNDIILLSLVRTYHVGHLRDPRRLVVAMSRARLGLYVFGNLQLFEGYSELDQCISVFKQYPNDLILNPDEVKKSRLITDKAKKTNQLKIESSEQMYEVVKNLLEKDIKN